MQIRYRIIPDYRIHVDCKWYHCNVLDSSKSGEVYEKK